MSDPHSSHDRDLGMHCRITRRDFLNGSAIALGSLGAGTHLLAHEEQPYLIAGGPAWYTLDRQPFLLRIEDRKPARQKSV